MAGLDVTPLMPASSILASSPDCISDRDRLSSQICCPSWLTSDMTAIFISF
jgi:hypothetical protein